MLNSPKNDRYTCTYSHSRNLHRKFVSLFHLPNCSRKHLYNSHIPFFYNWSTYKLPIFTYSHPYNLLQDLFPYLNHFPNSGRIEGPMDKRVWWGLALFNLLQPLRFMGRDNCTNNYWFLIAQAQKTVLLQVLISEEGISDQNGKPSNPPSRILSTYFYYFHTLLI